MDINSLLALVIIFSSLIILFILSQLLKSLISKQIDQKMKDIIPVKAIRERVRIRIKWKN